MENVIENSNLCSQKSTRSIRLLVDPSEEDEKEEILLGYTRKGSFSMTLGGESLFLND